MIEEHMMAGKSLIAGVIVAMVAGSAQAGTLWNVADGDWNTNTNWDPQVLPTAVDAIIDNDGIARIAADFTTNKEVGIGYEGADQIDAGTGGSGTVYQTAGTLDVNGGRLSLGNGDDVGIYHLEGGTLDAAAADAVIGANNSSAPAASGIIQSGTSNSKFKKMIIGDGYVAGDSGSKGFYEMKSSGTMVIIQYGLHIANAHSAAATGQQGIFTQTAGTVTMSGTHGTAGVNMGLGASNGGTAELHINGGVFHNARGIFAFANGAFVDIAGGTLRLNNTHNGGSTWDFTALTTKWANSDFRSSGDPATADNLVFTDTGSGTTDITSGGGSGGGGGGGNPYDTWADGAAFGDDTNGDGVDNGLAWILGATSKDANALAWLPEPANDGSFLTLDFDRVNPSAPARLFVQFSNDLANWTEWEIPASSNADIGGGVEVVVTGPGAPTPDTVTVKIPTSHESASGALFSRLRVQDN